MSDTYSDTELEEKHRNSLWYKRVSESKCGPLAVCGFGTFVILFMLSPAIIYSILLDGQYVYNITLHDCDMSRYEGQFPDVVKSFYQETQGFADVSQHVSWYLGNWRLYPYHRGLCPVNAQIPDSDTYEFFGVTVPEDGSEDPVFGVTDRYCLRLVGQEGDSDIPQNVVRVFEEIDEVNHRTGATPELQQSNMVAGLHGAVQVGDWLMFALVVTWVGIFINLSLFPSIGYHLGIPIFLNIIAWWVPSLLSLQEILFSSWNSNHTWAPMFPGCRIYTQSAVTPGVFMLYYQSVSLGIWVLAVSAFAFYTICCKKWSSKDEDGLQLDSLEIDRYIWRETIGGLDGESNTEFFKCSEGHMCYRTFGMPNCYRDACLLTGEINCSICDNTGIDEQKFFAYFTYCETCLETTGENAGSNYSVCMTCTSRWRDGINFKDLAHRSLHSADMFSGATMADVHLDSDSDSDDSLANKRVPQTLEAMAMKSMHGMKKTVRSSVMKGGGWGKRTMGKRPSTMDDLDDLELSL